MAEKKSIGEVDPFAGMEEDEDEDEDLGVNGGKTTKKRSPQLLASKYAMEQLDNLESSPRQTGDAERARALLKTIVYGRLSPQVSAVVKKAIKYDIDAAFAIAYQDWTGER